MSSWKFDVKISDHNSYWKSTVNNLKKNWPKSTVKGNWVFTHTWQMNIKLDKVKAREHYTKQNKKEIPGRNVD